MTDADKFAELMKSANAKILTGDFEGAIKDCTSAINLNLVDKRISAYAYSGRALAKDKLGRCEEALADYNEAIRFYPKNIDAWLYRCSLKNLLDRYEEETDDKFKMLMKSALAETALGDYEEAIAYFSQAIRLTPTDVEAWHNRGFAKYRLHRYQEAIADYDEALLLDSQFANAYIGRGRAENKLKRHADSLADYNEAIRLDPEFAHAWNNSHFAPSWLRVPNWFLVLVVALVPVAFIVFIIYLIFY